MLWNEARAVRGWLGGYIFSNFLDLTSVTLRRVYEKTLMLSFSLSQTTSKQAVSRNKGTIT